MIARRPLFVALAFSVSTALPSALYAGRLNPRVLRDGARSQPLTGDQKYGEQRSISSKDVVSLPANLTLDQLYRKWGYASLADPPIIQYSSDGAFEYYVAFALDDIPKIFAGDYHKVEVLGITLAGRGRYGEFPPTEVWTSEQVSPATRVPIDQIRDLPDELYLDQVQSRWGKSRVNGVVSDSTSIFFGNCSRDMFPPVASVSYRTPLDGYTLVFFLDWATAVESVKGKNTRVKVVSIYLIGPNHTALLEWGSYINPSTGALYSPPPRKDPFAPNPEPHPKGFLGLD
jgi:hypothetical protein